MPNTMGEEAAKRRQAEKSGNLDAYLESVGAGDDLKPKGYVVRDSPWVNSTNGTPDTIDRKNRQD